MCENQEQQWQQETDAGYWHDQTEEDEITVFSVFKSSEKGIQKISKKQSTIKHGPEGLINSQM